MTHRFFFEGIGEQPVAFGGSELLSVLRNQPVGCQPDAKMKSFQNVVVDFFLKQLDSSIELAGGGFPLFFF